MAETQKITLGSGKVYIAEYSGTIPEDATLEVSTNLLGAIKNGATLVYTPSYYEAKDDLGTVSKKILTDEVALLRLGVMTYNANTLKKIVATGRVTEDTTEKKRTIKIGGVGNQDGKVYVIRFLHEDPADGDIRVTIVGSNQSELNISFVKDSETIVNAEFKAIPNDSDGTLIIYEEEDSKITA